MNLNREFLIKNEDHKLFLMQCKVWKEHSHVFLLLISLFPTFIGSFELKAINRFFIGLMTSWVFFVEIFSDIWSFSTFEKQQKSKKEKPPITVCDRVHSTFYDPPFQDVCCIGAKMFAYMKRSSLFSIGFFILTDHLFLIRSLFRDLSKAFCSHFGQGDFFQ